MDLCFSLPIFPGSTYWRICRALHIRHSKAMHLLQSGVNLVYIRDLLGHVSVQTTEIYAKTDSRNLRKTEKYPDYCEKLVCTRSGIICEATSSLTPSIIHPKESDWLVSQFIERQLLYQCSTVVLEKKYPNGYHCNLHR